MDKQDLDAAFNRSFPPDFQVEMLRQLDEAYKESIAIAVADYGPAFGKNVRPQIRVENFNKRLISLAKMFRLKAEPCLTVAKNYRFALVEGREILLLVRLGEKPGKLPHPTVYIQERIEKNPAPTSKQLSITDIEVEIPTTENSVISLKEYRETRINPGEANKPCGILVHGYSKSASLNFAQFLVPDSEYSSYLTLIDLFARYSGAIAVPQEEVIEISEPIIRKKETREGDA